MAKQVTPMKKRKTPEEVTRRMRRALRDEADQIENWKNQIALATRRRDALIVKLCDRGVSERELGRDAKVTSPRINQIYHGTSSSKRAA
jgi:hypothetical protein